MNDLSFVLILALAFAICSFDGGRTSADRRIDRERIDVERRQLYLNCLHQYSLGTVVAEDLDYDLGKNRKLVTAACAKLARLNPETIP